MIRQLEAREAVYLLGHDLLDFTELEHLEVWVEEGWLDASTHEPLGLELKSVSETTGRSTPTKMLEVEACPRTRLGEPSGPPDPSLAGR